MNTRNEDQRADAASGSVTGAIIIDASTETLKQTIAQLEKTLADVAARDADELKEEREDLRHERNHELLGKYLDVRHDVTKASIERARDSAKFVQTASAAIASLYTGLLALIFSTESETLPLRGVFAAVFLGLAVAGSTAYLAFLRRGRSVEVYHSAYSPETTGLRRADHLTRWVNASILRSSWVLRAAVVALAVGVAFIPAPFVGGSPAPAPAAVTPPQIPEEIPAAIADEAAALFERQVDDYLASLDTVPSPPPKIEYAHDGPTGIFYRDSWLNGNALVGGDKLDSNFFWAAVWAFGGVLALPTLWSLGELGSRVALWFFGKRLRRPHPDQWVTAVQAFGLAVATAIALGLLADITWLVVVPIIASVVAVVSLVYAFGRADARRP